MKPLKPIETEYWDSYIDSLPDQERPKFPFVEAFFAGTKETTDESWTLQEKRRQVVVWWKTI